jgi:hypothetical protein
MAPGTYSALLYMFRVLQAFKSNHQGTHPEWFRKDAGPPMTEAQVVGTYQQPGILFKITMIREADKRVQQQILALRQYRLPPMPGFAGLCGVPTRFTSRPRRTQTQKKQR